ncbi:hypothetical protein BDB01DRAFT_773134 [Pilobolus umbonatus]|nr:hypothetical protein BDB01DRAFT_773134 [Pilobolus umbonatus]
MWKREYRPLDIYGKTSLSSISTANAPFHRPQSIEYLGVNSNCSSTPVYRGNEFDVFRKDRLTDAAIHVVTSLQHITPTYIQSKGIDIQTKNSHTQAENSHTQAENSHTQAEKSYLCTHSNKRGQLHTLVTTTVTTKKRRIAEHKSSKDVFLRTTAAVNTPSNFFQSVQGADMDHCDLEYY